ncbi:MAG TPA: protein translocase subunit SecD [Trebonia sp.]|nr:protein translocase subunit SecD [Trebonia sp.]
MAPPSRSGSRPGRALAALAVLILIMLISITGKETFSPGNWHKQFKVGLGLDLSSGTEVVLKAATAKGVPSSGAMTQAISVLESRVNGTGNSGAQVQQTGADLITVTVPGKAAQDTVQLVSSTAKLSFRQVLLEEPYSAASATPSATPSTKASGSASPSASSSATATPTTSASTSATPKASGQAYAASPVATSSSSAKASSTAKATPATSASATATPTTSSSATATATPTPTATSTGSASTTLTYGDSSKVNAATLKLFNKMVCKPGPNANTVDDSWKKTVGYSESGDQWDNNAGQIVSCDANGTKYVLAPSVFEGTQLTGVSPGLQQNSTQWVVNLTLNSAAAKAFGTLTTSQYNTYYSQAVAGNQDSLALDSTAIVLDGNVQSAPMTEGALTSGQFTISGPQPDGFTEAEANQLTNILKYGSLPLNFNIQTVSSISPQLGHSSLDAGLIAGILGLILVIIYLFYYYRGLGLVSVSSLLMAALLAYLAVVILSRYQNFTMSLSAIAGLVVAIGITADSFIVYFERLRDEVREGKTLRPAVESGWKRARRTILVSDTVSFLAALLLYHFAVSDVQGFAYTLGLTTLIDVLVVFLFTKPMVTLLAGTKFFSSGNKWSGLDPERLGAQARWRSSTRRTVRTQRTSSARSTTNSSTSREA